MALIRASKTLRNEFHSDGESSRIILSTSIKAARLSSILSLDGSCKGLINDSIPVLPSNDTLPEDKTSLLTDDCNHG